MPTDPIAHLPSRSLPGEEVVEPRHSASDGDEGTLRLLRACVEAMSLLQAQVEGFDKLVETAQSDTRKELANLRVEFAGMLGTQSRDGARLTEAEAQIGRVQAGAQDLGKRLSDDIANARGEASHWRMRVETDAMAFDQLSARIAALEDGTLVKLEAAEGRLRERDEALAARAEENAQLKSETRVIEAASERLRGQLTALEATIADQRARIGCLQNKLATASYAMRLDHMSRDINGPSATPGPDILDLAPPPPLRGRISAA